jgi:hypothetical protein
MNTSKQPSVLFETLLEHFKKTPSPNSAVALEQVGDAVSRVPKDAKTNVVELGGWQCLP